MQFNSTINQYKCISTLKLFTIYSLGNEHEERMQNITFEHSKSFALKFYINSKSESFSILLFHALKGKESQKLQKSFPIST